MDSLRDGIQSLRTENSDLRKLAIEFLRTWASLRGGTLAAALASGSFSLSDLEAELSRSLSDYRADRDVLQKSQSKLSRLQEHLLETHEQHTKESLVAEQRTEELVRRLEEAERERDKLLRECTAQAESRAGGALKVAELNTVIEKKSREVQRLSDELQRSELGLKNLQEVLEQFQAGEHLISCVLFCCARFV
jgi:chromosome segregation ATPase